jgi:lysophospholipase L1-like esterase
MILANRMKISGSSFACRLLLVTAAVFAVVLRTDADDKSRWKFDFGPGDAPAGYTRVLPNDVYTPERGFGFESGTQIVGIDRGGPDLLRRDFCTSDKPFYFSVDVPEGNYRVTAILGDSKGVSTNTIKAELRRLMIENARTQDGKTVSCTFVVNVRTPAIPGGGEVKLKERERASEMGNWDRKLTLEFNGARPCVCAVDIESAPEVPTVFLLGDSTVCDQPAEPWNSWGQMLPRFFGPDIAIANHAESGESLKSSLAAHRLDKVLSAMKSGDYLFIQYGHNDMKDKATNALAVYATNLKRFVDGARQKGGIPVLITSMERKAGRDQPTLADYPDAVRRISKEEHVPLIDLNVMSVQFYRALGPDRIDRAFQDGTHHNNYGSYELARCVVEGIKANHLVLANHLVSGLSSFDPSQPDPIDTFDVPASPENSQTKPLGN